jgi:sortase A
MSQSTLEPEAPAAEEAGDGPAPTAAAKPASRGAARTAALSLSLLLAMIVGFFLYLLFVSGLQQHRVQDTMYATFRGSLAKATAPVAAPIREGAPVAVLRVPSLHLSQVVVEGSDSSDLMLGPGHRRDTVLPGQPGISVVLGRRETFGAPFARLGDLRAGDLIQVVTGLGTANYRMVSVRNSNAAFSANQPANRLVLVTSDPAWGASRSLIATAELTTAPFPVQPGLPAIRADEQPLAGESSALLALVLWGQGLLLTVALTVVAYATWRRWTTYLITTPVLLAVLWNVYENIARLLPNTL